jgi:hypothetical protein
MYAHTAHCYYSLQHTAVIDYSTPLPQPISLYGALKAAPGIALHLKFSLQEVS